MGEALGLPEQVLAAERCHGMAAAAQGDQGASGQRQRHSAKGSWLGGPVLGSPRQEECAVGEVSDQLGSGSHFMPGAY